MKKIKDLYNLDKLQKNINVAILNLQGDTSDYLDNGSNLATYCFETIVSSGAGQYALKEFSKIFGFRYYKDEQINYECSFEWFDKVAKEIKKLVSLPDEGFDIYIDFNENDGAIDMFLTKELIGDDE